MAFQALCLHNWPGNVRELSKVLETATALAADEAVITIEHLPGHHRGQPPSACATPPRPQRPPAAHARPSWRNCSADFRATSPGWPGRFDRKAPLIYRWCRRYKLDPEAFRAQKD